MGRSGAPRAVENIASSLDGGRVVATVCALRMAALMVGACCATGWRDDCCLGEGLWHRFAPGAMMNALEVAVGV